MAHAFGWIFVIFAAAGSLVALAQWRRARGYALGRERRLWFEYSRLAASYLEEFQRP